MLWLYLIDLIIDKLKHQAWCHPLQPPLTYYKINNETTNESNKRIKRSKRRLIKENQRKRKIINRAKHKQNKKPDLWFWEKDFLHYLKKDDKIWVFDEDINQWKIGKIMEKKEKKYKYKQNPNYIFKLQINWERKMKKNYHTYFMWLSIDKFATSSTKMDVYTGYYRPKSKYNSFPYNIDRKKHLKNACNDTWSARKECIMCQQNAFCECAVTSIDDELYCCYKCIDEWQKKEIKEGIDWCRWKIYTMASDFCQYCIPPKWPRYFRPIQSNIIAYAMGYVLTCDHCNFEVFAKNEFQRKEFQHRVTECRMPKCDKTFCYRCRDELIEGICKDCVSLQEIKRYSKMLKNTIDDIITIDDAIANGTGNSNIYKQLQASDLIEIISEYSMGYVLQCNVDKQKRKCNGEIFIENEQILNRMLSEREHYLYHVRDRYVTERNEKYLTRIYGKYVRIQCDECTNATACNICYTNKDAKFNPCLDHPECQVCNKRCSSYGFRNCDSCRKGYCKKCGIINNVARNKSFCKNCVIKREHEKVDTALSKGIEINIDSTLLQYFDLNIASIITEYAVGIVIECMVNECDQEIFIENEYDFDKSKFMREYPYKQYILPKSDRMVTVKLFGKHRRMFCMKCFKKRKIKKCKFCYNLDEYKICGVHELCKCCNQRRIKYNCHWRYNCIVCKNKFCKQCDGGKNKCKKCVKIEVLQHLFENCIDDEYVIKVLSGFLNDIPFMKQNVNKKSGCNDWNKEEKRKRRMKNERIYRECDSMNDHLMDYGYIQQFYGRI